jgi:hypothetical protein
MKLLLPKFLIFISVIILVYYIGWSELVFPERLGYLNIGDYIKTATIVDVLHFSASHLLLLFCVFLFCISVSRSFRVPARIRLYIFISILLIWLYNIFADNLKHYPELETSLISYNLNAQVLHVTTSALLFSLAMVAIILRLRQSRKMSALLLMVAITLHFSPLFNRLDHRLETPVASLSENKHIWIIGIDSVSHDQLFKNRGQLPAINALLSYGTSYVEAYTPLARTYPAWNSILTGRYPFESGARFNLTEFPGDSVKDNLVRDLSSIGYTTVYAQDERRFNNINQEYGFDEVVGPSAGFSDFILPQFKDNPISAYYLRSFFGADLFPSLHSNRVASIVYSPDLFTSHIQTTIEQYKDTPTFLAVHHCLAHFPYTWRDSPEIGTSEIDLHKQALEKVDWQIQQLIETAKSTGIYDSLYIVFLSDHGEGLGDDPRTWFTNSDSATERFFRGRRGHGNSLAAVDQNHIFLHISTPHDRQSQSYATIKKVASLIDIRPTVMDYLGSDITYDGFGMSLHAPESIPLDRRIYMETGVKLALPQVNQSEASILQDNKDLTDFYATGDDGFLRIKPEFYESQLQIKQYGYISQNEITIFDPQLFDKNLITLNRVTGGHHISSINKRPAVAHNLCPLQNSLCNIEIADNNVTNLPASEDMQSGSKSL